MFSKCSSTLSDIREIIRSLLVKKLTFKKIFKKSFDTANCDVQVKEIRVTSTTWFRQTDFLHIWFLQSSLTRTRGEKVVDSPKELLWMQPHERGIVGRDSIWILSWQKRQHVIPTAPVIAVTRGPRALFDLPSLAAI